MPRKKGKGPPERIIGLIESVRVEERPRRGSSPSMTRGPLSACSRYRSAERSNGAIDEIEKRLNHSDARRFPDLTGRVPREGQPSKSKAPASDSRVGGFFLFEGHGHLRLGDHHVEDGESIGSVTRLPIRRSPHL